MQYEFELFDKIINEFSRPFVNQSANLNEYKSIFQSKFDAFYNIIVANFKKSNKGLVLNSKKVICSLHPEIDSINDQQISLFQDNVSEVLDSKALRMLRLKSDDIVNFGFQNSQSTNKIYIKVKSSYDSLQLNEARYYYYNLILKDEVARIKKSINEHVFSLRSQEEIEHYIHKLQQVLINLSFRVSKLFGSESRVDIYKSAQEFNDRDILYLIYISIEDLLRFFESSFLKYIDQNIQVPYRSDLAKLYNIPEKLEVVKAAFLKSAINTELLNIIYKPFLELSIISFPERVTYQRLIYSNTLLTAFYDEIQLENQILSLPLIIDILFLYNFNSKLLFNYKVNKMKSKVIEYSDTSSQIDYLYHCLKTINQRQCMSHIAYETNLPTLRVQLISWLEEEITYLNKKIALNIQQSALVDNKIEPQTKIMSGLSVSQLAHFFKLLFEVGVITHDNQSDIIRFLAFNFQTANAKNISIDSLKNKFYYIDETNAEPLKDYVIKMLNKLR